MINFRAPAYPLITVDPFFSVWSMSDHLEEKSTRHWTGRPAPIVMTVETDEGLYWICCFDKFDAAVQGEKRLFQTGVSVTPLSTIYTFENDIVKAVVKFTTPLLLDRLDILTRPVSYIEYKLERKDGKEGKLKFGFGISSECCVNDFDREVSFENTGYSLKCGNVIQNPLAYSGDSVLPDWGYLHLCDRNAYTVFAESDDCFVRHIKKVPSTRRYVPYTEKPYLYTTRDDKEGVITVAYEEIKAIEYFGDKLLEYYTKYFDSFEGMIAAAVSEYPEIIKLCDKFDDELTKEAEKLGENYKNIVSLTYRQAIAAHKIVEDREGNILMLSKECHSNGCIGTLDVTYPSIPLFLKYNPELVLGMLRPIIKYAKSPEWKFDFTPHDVGQYPIANGQVYGNNSIEFQMPVEEAGNMLLCVAAAAKYSGSKEFFINNKEILKKWADYLVKFGYDPGEQLCTDDFAGHLSHNCNLSLKAILGIASYGELSGENSYTDIAKEYAKKWEKEAKNQNATRLTFDNEDSWSLKYNIIWDKILGYNIFTEELKKKEVEYYLTKFNRYGVPLDSRKDYTKIDWLMWSTRIYDNKEYFDKVCESIVCMFNETHDRVPVSDWYSTKTAVHYFFQNRTVVGGLFINLI